LELGVQNGGFCTLAVRIEWHCVTGGVMPGDSEWSRSVFEELSDIRYLKEKLLYLQKQAGVPPEKGGTSF